MLGLAISVFALALACLGLWLENRATRRRQDALMWRLLEDRADINQLSASSHANAECIKAVADLTMADHDDLGFLMVERQKIAKALNELAEADIRIAPRPERDETEN